MAKFKVYSSQLVYHVTEIEAEDEEQAVEIAWEDNCEWKEFQLGDWEIEDVQLVEDDSTINAVKSINKDIREGLV